MGHFMTLDDFLRPPGGIDDVVGRHDDPALAVFALFRLAIGAAECNGECRLRAHI